MSQQLNSSRSVWSPCLGLIGSDPEVVFEGFGFTESNFREEITFQGQLMRRHRNGGGWVPAIQSETDESIPYVAPTVYVGPTAMVFGSARLFDQVRLTGFARVFDSAVVSDNVWISSTAQVCGNATVSGSAYIYGDAWVSGFAKVYGRSQLASGAKACGHVCIAGDAHVSRFIDYGVYIDGFH